MSDHETILSGLRNAPKQLKKDMKVIPDPFTPIKPGEWNLHQIVCHMRDTNAQVYLPRLKRILNEHNPVFENFDGEKWMAEHYDATENISDIVRDFADGCEEIAAMLEDLPDCDWERTGTHTALGTNSLEWWAERTLNHIDELLRQEREE